MEKKTAINRMGLLAFLLVFSANCNKSAPDDLLGMILSGRMAMSFPMWSHAGVGNQGAVLENTLVSTIGLSRTSVQCSFQDVNLGTVTDALFNAKARGVKVRVGLDEDNRTQPGYRRLSEFLVTGQEDNELYVGNAGAGQVYSNICVGDATRVFLSTAPPTIQGFYSEPAFAWYFQDSETGLPRKFQSEMDLITHGSFGSSKAVLNRQNFYLLTDMEVGVYMAPKEGGFENFAVQRIKQATNSIRVFSTEFFSNDLDGSDVRRAKDLAFEIKNASTGSKQVIVSSYAALASDPDAAGGLNSATYLSNAGLQYRTLPGGWPDNGLNFVLVDGETSHPQLYLTSFPFSARADSAHDGFLLVFEYAPMVQAFADFYSQIQGRAVLTVNTVGDNIASANQMEVVISELNWMGSYNTSQSANTSEYVELYNNTNSTLNISGWLVQCGVGGAFATTVATIPQRTLIGAGQFFVLAQSSSGTVAQPHSGALAGSGLISDTTTEQCRITDGPANGNTVIDVIGVSGTALSSNSTAFGLNNTTSHLRRSMERNTLNAAGDNTTNWHTNSHTSVLQNLNFIADKIERTFGTPGYYNSSNTPVPATPVPSPTGVVINELRRQSTGSVHWIELYNTTSSAIDLAATNAYIHRDTGNCDLVGTNAVALTGTIPANGYYMLAINTIGGTEDQLGNFSSLTDNNCVALTNSATAPGSATASSVVDFVGYGASTFFEGSAAATNLTNASVLMRCPNGSDTNQNGNNWVLLAEANATPKAANTNCPTFDVTAAASTAATTATLTFNAAPNSSQATTASNYKIVGGAGACTDASVLSVTGASLAGSVVTLTTASQTGGTSYKICVDPSTAVTRNSDGANLTTSSFNFTGFTSLAVLKIVEFNSNIGSQFDLIEIKVITGGTLNGLILRNNNASGAATVHTFQNITVTTGDIIIIHMNGSTETGAAPASESTGKTHYPVGTYTANFDNAWDFHGSATSIVATDTTMLVCNGTCSSGNVQDAVAFSNKDGTSSAAFIANIQDLQTLTSWTPTLCGGVACTDGTTPSVQTISASITALGTTRGGNSSRRTFSAGTYTDTDAASDWSVGASSWGADN